MGGLNREGMALTDKQQRFAEEYLVDLNASQAAIRAGYSRKTADQQGHQLLKKTSVAAEIQKRMDARSDRVEISADYVLETIRDTIEQCRRIDPVPDGEGGVTMPYNPTAVLKGAELLGKHLKLFTDKVEHSGGIKMVPVEAQDEDI